ncbi:MAG: hypothetical protein WC391_04750 [Methanoregula sp.]|jgi:hypothetical protein
MSKNIKTPLFERICLYLKLTNDRFKPYAPILTLFFTLIAAAFGAFAAVHFQNETRQQTTLKLVYDDIDNTNYSLHCLNQMLENNPTSLPYIFTPVYPDNGIYYSSRSDIAALDDYSLARNISTFYNDLHYAEVYRIALVNVVDKNFTVPAVSDQINVSINQYKWAIQDANALQHDLLNEIDKKNNIPKNPIKNRFNKYQNC